MKTEEGIRGTEEEIGGTGEKQNWMVTEKWGGNRGTGEGNRGTGELMSRQVVGNSRGREIDVTIW